MRQALFVISSLIVSLTFAQQLDSLDSIEVIDTLVAEENTDIITEDIVPKERKTALNFGIHVDYGKVLTLPFDFENKYEGGLVLEVLENIELVGEYGYWDKKSEQAIANGTYNSKGNYWRLGAGAVLPFNSPGNSLGIGFRYGGSSFEDEGTYDIVSVDGLTSPFQSGFSRQDLSASWISGVLTSMSRLQLRKKDPESRLNNLFKIGFQFRWRFLRSYDRSISDTDPIEVYTIPGYGRTISDNAIALNFFVRFYPLGY